MATNWKSLGRNTQVVIQLLIVLSCVALIFLIFPKVNRFQYDFEKGKPWQYEDLISPFSYSLQKDESTIAKERADILDLHEPHFSFQNETTVIAQEKLVGLLNSRIKQLGTDSISDEYSKQLQNTGKQILDSIFGRGIIEETSELENFVLLEDDVAKYSLVSDYLTVDQSNKIIRDYKFESSESESILTPILLSVMAPNIVFNKEMNDAILDNKLSKIAASKGMIQKGEKVVENGDIVDNVAFQKLSSLEAAYSEKVLGNTTIRRVGIGYILAILIVLTVLVVYLYYFRRDLFFNFRHFFFIFLLIVIPLALLSLVFDKGPIYLYAIPFCIIPIVIRAFFGRELALYVHLSIVLIAGLFVPKPFTFVFVTIVAGTIAILGNKNVRYWSQFFKAIGLVFIAYLLSFVASYLMSDNEIASFEPMLFGALAINAFLTFLAYPLIPLFEKLFGLISEISLVEYTDLNKPVLKRLSIEAPGTFQHSLQVANLAEAATVEVGGNSLLVKVGGLYHDIGKLSNPVYFIENQSPNKNPHKTLGYDESAEIIIAHVPEGVKIAKKANLPKPILDFIQTHHGTSRVEYFYRLHTQENIPEDVDENKFIYPGPKPFTKEQAILMMADSVEAASKSLKNPVQEDLDKLVDGIVAHQMSRGQFDNAPITFKEISRCKMVFKKMLASINHIRVEYPEE